MTRARSVDVGIVGGGPAGLYVATRLARAGVDVLLLEEYQVIGVPVHCTGVVSRDLYEDFDVPREAILNELRTLRLGSPSGHRLEYVDTNGEAIVIDRKRFDAALARRATIVGAEILTGRRVTGVEITPADARLTLADGEIIRARACVLACGASYAFQRRLGLGVPARLLQSAQLEVPAAPMDRVEVRFGSAVASRGFAWAVPVERPDGPYARIGLMTDNHALECFQQMLDGVAPAWGVVSESAPRPRLKIFPLAPIPRTYADRVLAIGDAAGLVKPTIGGGIYYSIMSAELASEALLDAMAFGDFSAAALRPYEERWRGELSRELRAQQSLQSLAERLDDEGIDQLFELARTDGILPLIRRTARFNLHRPFISALLRHEGARNILFRHLIS